MSQAQPPDQPGTGPPPLVDWRGVPLEIGQRVVYVPNKLDALYEAYVYDLTTNWRGAIQVRIIRRNNANASYTDVETIIWAMPGRLTVVIGLPASPYPSDDQLRAQGASIAAERRKAMSQAGRPKPKLS